MNKDLLLIYKNNSYKFIVQPNLTYDYFLIYFPQKESNDCYIKINNIDIDAQNIYDYCSNIFDNELDQDSFDEILFNSKFETIKNYIQSNYNQN